MSTAPHKIIAQNRRAKFDYELLETFEGGIILLGSEVKSLRLGGSSINEAFAGEMTLDGHAAIYLFNANIAEYPLAHQFNHDPKRPRKLLLHKKQVHKLLGSIRKKGLTIIPLSLYFNEKGRIKVSIALGRGKKTVDKRATIKERDWQRDKARVLRARG